MDIHGKDGGRGTERMGLPTYGGHFMEDHGRRAGAGDQPAPSRGWRTLERDSMGAAFLGRLGSSGLENGVGRNGVPVPVSWNAVPITDL